MLKKKANVNEFVKDTIRYKLFLMQDYINNAYYYYFTVNGHYYDGLF